MYKDLSQETVEWICEHDRGEQVARIAEASREIDKAKQKARILEELRERAKAKLDALAKLTMDERRVLGLMDERRVLGL